ncbi:uncharacterized protein LOC135821271 [Sycon ciliatum]|uniref:uncharacterized protein LOC135821271 n=1 Tax=Sycon ciliatum TaxID=27933 RepID=UPI0020AD96AB|eukprot:scpid82499/ scgid34350/ 
MSSGGQAGSGAAGSGASRPVSSGISAGLQGNPHAQRNRPASADWTRGHEVHMEGREPFQVWRSGLHSQIASLEKNLDNVEDQIDELEDSGDDPAPCKSAEKDGKVGEDPEAMVRAKPIAKAQPKK